MDLALDILQWLICHKAKQNLNNPFSCWAPFIYHSNSWYDDDRYKMLIRIHRSFLKRSINIMLYFDLLTRPKMPFKVMQRKEVIHSNGSYERKSRGRKLADEMRQGKAHDALIDWCTGREWPVNCMTVISAWWRLNIRFQRSSGRSCRRWTII